MGEVRKGRRREEKFDMKQKRQEQERSRTECTVQCSTVWYSTVQYSTLQYGRVGQDRIGPFTIHYSVRTYQYHQGTALPSVGASPAVWFL